MSSTFQAWMKSIQTEVEVSLQDYLPSAQNIPQRLHEAMAYAVLDGGKRVRPLLVFAAGKLFNAPQELLSRAACAVEMIHAYSLVHDDMPCMDDDALRRGKPTVHKKYDEATALLVGDALQAQAFLVLSESAANAEQKLPMIQLLAHASGSVGMCGGQAIDLASVGLSLTREQLEQMHRLKTGALLRASVMLGAMSGKRLENNEVAALDVYSAAIGLAFQVVDDVLDATADSATLGKTAGKDAADNKPTYVSLLGLEASQQLAQQLCQDAHQALTIFGESAQHLHDLADLIVQRKA
jgi:farnesyl diphosphate synthase